MVFRNRLNSDLVDPGVNRPCRGRVDRLVMGTIRAPERASLLAYAQGSSMPPEVCPHVSAPSHTSWAWLRISKRANSMWSASPASQSSQLPTPMGMWPPAISSDCRPRYLPPPRQENASGRTCGGLRALRTCSPSTSRLWCCVPWHEKEPLARQILSAVDEVTLPQRVAAGEVIGQALAESDHFPDLKTQVTGELWLRDLELTTWRVLHADHRSDDPAGRTAFLDAWTSV